MPDSLLIIYFTSVHIHLTDAHTSENDSTITKVGKGRDRRVK
jgi:hypothetical protein